MEKLSSRWVKLRLGYWRRLQVASSDRTLAAVVSLRRKHLEWGHKGACDGWMSTTKELLSKHGLSSYWTNPNLCSAQTLDQWKDTVYEAVEKREDMDLNKRFAGMRGVAAARYARIKNWNKVTPEFAVMKGEGGRRGAHVIEPYLDGRAEGVGTRLKLMCRLGCLPIMTRVVREEGLPPAMGCCKLCGEGAEDVRHLLLDCKKHDRHREKMLLRVGVALDTTAHTTTFSQMEESERIDTLLGKSTGEARADSRINESVTRFLKTSWGGRGWLTMELNDRFSRQDTTWATGAHGDKCGWASTPSRLSGRR